MLQTRRLLWSYRAKSYEITGPPAGPFSSFIVHFWGQIGLESGVISRHMLISLHGPPACHAAVLQESRQLAFLFKEFTYSWYDYWPCANFVPLGCVTSWFVVEHGNGCHKRSA